MMSLKNEAAVWAAISGMLIFTVSAAGGRDLADSGHEAPGGMVLVEAGEFLMGAAGEADYSPVHAVFIDSFYIDKHEVTNAEYFVFCEATERGLPEFWGMDVYHCGPDYPCHPVVGVSWADASAYAEWAGKRLPTEAEWEKAGRGGLIGENYPNGSDVDTTIANFTFKGLRRGTMPVGSFAANGYGIHDMSGNVVEWVVDSYGEDYYKESPYENPTGMVEKRLKVIRGGGWHSGPFCCRVFFRNALPANWVDFAVGFRCAKDVKK